MPKALREYNWRQWLRLQPLTHAVKTARYRKIDRRFLSLPAKACDIQGTRDAARGRDVLLTIAFGNAQCLDLQVRLIRGLVRHDLHIVADNSVSEAAADENRQVCAAYGASYVRLPANPWTVKNPSRSHGAALNWMWHNILKPAAPAAFGFLDQDIFPTQPCDPFAPLQHVAFYGDLRRAGARWYLWAGYCFFRFDAVARKPLDFGLDWFAGLDTGGANWEVLYRDVDPNALPQRPITAFAALPGVELRQAYLRMAGNLAARSRPRRRSLVEGEKARGRFTLAGTHPSGPAQIGATMRLAVDTVIELCDGT
ncbi:hypothetical protein [Mesorhizobium sp. M2A.F.Ca.ET.043.02.1.1]|uniref:hypothetical protein n=1 Tax=Mesorhizobium sp. M2A.F.Ca.ET.043.02.1.1 TaxID=2493670 RepID=UPI000F7554C5|nr:hypothetical protein [Mesorhizobium sp. M2A.F.Ca.ET.043.02.1.1]AZO06731.1 hypothetical protein EJ068_29490 [Mesorhizobium sp. M2A.F.Ca.ET.043.02.1.1]